MTYQSQITQLIKRRTHQDGLTETGIAGVKLFRATDAMPCQPVIYEPCVIAITSGAKEAVLGGEHYVYDQRQYLCCPMSIPLQAGTPDASSSNPLYGVYISLNHRVLSELVFEIESAEGNRSPKSNSVQEHAIRLAHWDPAFSDALLRLLQLSDDTTSASVLGEARLRELYFAILQGEAGAFARHAYSLGNAIARSIAHVTSNLDEAIAIDDLATLAGMSRAVFHRKFKQATSMSPIQFVKSMRLNKAAMQISEGMNVSEAAMQVGYVSPSQFSREFKRMYGQSPRQWGSAKQQSMARIA